MLRSWIREDKEQDLRCIFAPIGRVDLRRTEKQPAPLPIPPHSTRPVGVSHLTQLHNGSRQFVGCQTKRQGWRQPPHQSLKRNGDWSLVSKDGEAVSTRERHTGSSDVGSVTRGGEQPGTAPIERLR